MGHPGGNVQPRRAAAPDRKQTVAVLEGGQPLQAGQDPAVGPDQVAGNDATVNPTISGS
ncbi:MAG: hypothetical protein L0332_09185 [Chloroflexi bacterium]|nr:hypothetical protein [Chloroflexota bacterium]MCI0575300.1 hypothetical protein [Chloroflexota bacterium]MCI0645525.1 hypothetical protein [Chloroflexota bacterium]MCI0726879.1 hypothetical protein [Chloroflexota bacterium]